MNLISHNNRTRMGAIATRLLVTILLRLVSFLQIDKQRIHSTPRLILMDASI